MGMLLGKFCGFVWFCVCVGFGIFDVDDIDVCGWDWLESVVVVVILIFIIWGKFGVLDCVVVGICFWFVVVVVVVEVGIFEIKVMKLFIIIWVFIFGCLVCVDDEFVLVFELVILLFVVVVVEGCCLFNKFDNVFFVVLLLVEVFIFVLFVEVSCVLVGVVEFGCDILDMIVVREILFWGLIWIFKFWLVFCGCWFVLVVDWVVFVVVED